MQVLELDAQYVLNWCARCLARDVSEVRHATAPQAAASSARFAEAWRFPLIDVHQAAAAQFASVTEDRVTFVYDAGRVQGPMPTVGVLGTFANLHTPLPLQRVGETPYHAITIVVGRGQVHTYRFVVDGELRLDPVNPQRTTLLNGQVWSRFFTHSCSTPLVLERHERQLLSRLTGHILPFRTQAAENFLNRFAADLQREAATYPVRQLFDGELGVVNFIDKVLAREEAHHEVDYHLCLAQLQRVLRARNPFVEPEQMPAATYAQLYAELAENSVPGWDYGRYGRPQYFLELLRRHTYTGAFSHPKYGGNAAAAAWAWLAERYRDGQGRSLFAWRAALEPPLGSSPDYRG